MKRIRFALRLLSRIVVVAIVAAFVTVVALQYARIIGKNATMANQLVATENDLLTLETKRIEQDRRIRRLSDPVGVIPDIHDKLHLVRDHEVIIYLKKHGGP